MKILFDQGTPNPLRRELTGHEVRTAYEMGWAQLQNGDLLREAEAAVFEVFLTTEKRIRYEQNLAGRRLAILVLPTTSWPVIQKHVQDVVRALDSVAAGELREIVFNP